jgi:hypothetical protein
MGDFTSAVMGALAGAVAGYFSAWARKRREDTKRRKVVGTVQHVEPPARRA